MAKIAYSIAEFSRIASISRPDVYDEINAGRLKVAKVGRRTIITADEAHAWLARVVEEGTPAPK